MSFVVQIADNVGAAWCAIAEGARLSWSPGWANKSQFLLVSRSRIEPARPHIALDQVVFGVDDDVDQLFPANLPERVCVVESPLASTRIILDIGEDETVGRAQFLIEIWRGRLIASRFVARGEDLGAVDVAVHLPLRAYLLLLVGELDLNDLVPVFEVEGQLEHFLLFVAFMDSKIVSDALQERLASHRGLLALLMHGPASVELGGGSTDDPVGQL